MPGTQRVLSAPHTTPNYLRIRHTGCRPTFPIQNVCGIVMLSKLRNVIACALHCTTPASRRPSTILFLFTCKRPMRISVTSPVICLSLNGCVSNVSLCRFIRSSRKRKSPRSLLPFWTLRDEGKSCAIVLSYVAKELSVPSTFLDRFATRHWRAFVRNPITLSLLAYTAIILALILPTLRMYMWSGHDQLFPVVRVYELCKLWR